MKYKNITQGVIYLKDGIQTKAISPGEEFDAENLIKVTGISVILPPRKKVLLKPEKVAKKLKETSDGRSTTD